MERSDKKVLSEANGKHTPQEFERSGADGSTKFTGLTKEGRGT